MGLNEGCRSRLQGLVSIMSSIFLGGYLVMKIQVEGLCRASVTVMILDFRTDRSGQTVQTQIRLLLEEQSDQGLHCWLFHLHVFDKMPLCLASLFEFKVNYSKVSCVQKFRNFTVIE